MLYQGVKILSPLLFRTVLLALCVAAATSELPLGSVAAEDLVDVWVEPATSDNSSYCCPDTWLYVRADYLYWWTRGAHLPPLVTTSPAGVELPDAGVLGEPGTDVLFGDELTASGPRSGIRWSADVLLDGAGQWWLTTDWLFPATLSDRFHATSAGDLVLARPFYDLAIGLPNSELVSYPRNLAGGISIDASNDFWGAAALLRKNLVCCQWDGNETGYRIDFLAGYRFLKLSDNVRIYEQLVSVDPRGPLLAGTALEVTDMYQSHSSFHGFELGLQSEMARNGYFIAAQARVALGSSFHRLRISGDTTVTVPGQPPVDFPGGLFAHGTAWGNYRDHEFAVVPQAELRVGRRLTDHLRCSLGYSLLYWSQVVRAGEQINTALDSTQLPAPGSSPTSDSSGPLSSSSFWAQGLTATLEWDY